MDINYPRLFSPWHEGETQRVVVTGFTGEKGADKVIPKVQKHFPKEQFEAKCFFGLKVVNLYDKELGEIRKSSQEKYEKKVEENRRVRVQNLEWVDLVVFRITLVSGAVLFGLAYRFGKGKHQKGVFIAALVVPFVAYPCLKKFGHSYYPEVILEREKEPEPKSQKNTYELVLHRHDGHRTLPPNFKHGEETDLLTCEELTEEKLGSPEVIFLPNYVVDSKAYVHSCLENGAIRDTIYRREFTDEEYEKVITQISQIFGISSSDLWSCFDDVFLEESTTSDYRGVDKTGQYTNQAKHALSYAFSNLEDSGMKEIDRFFQDLQNTLYRVVEGVCSDPSFREEYDRYMRLLCLPEGAKLSHQAFPNLFKLTETEFKMLTIKIGEIPFIRAVYLPTFLELISFEAFGPSQYQKKMEKKLKKLKISYIRAFRLEILSATLFNGEMRKADKSKVRVERFEKLTGFSLSESEGGSSG